MLSRYPVISLYLQPKVIAVLFLGIASGLPRLLILSTLTIWLTEVGINHTTIGVLSAVSLPYAIKFLWSPLIDQLHIPYLTRKFGRRRSWLFILQILLAASIFLMGTSNPAENIALTAMFAFLIAFFSASQDIVIDAYRVEILKEDQQGAGAAMIVLGYRIGMLIASAGGLYIASYAGWFATYLTMAIIIFVGSITAFFIGEKKYIPEDKKTAKEWIKHAVIDPFSNFITRRGWYLILLFIVLYKFGDAFSSVMSGVLYIELGYSKNEIASVGKIFGFAAIIAGAITGGSVISRMGIYKSLFIFGILQMVSTAVFMLLTYVGYNIPLLAFTIGFENFTSGMGTAAAIAYMSDLCDKEYTATQYALFSSFSAFALSLLSAPSGWFVEQLGWINFFLLSTVIAIPGLFLIILIWKMDDKSKKYSKIT